MRELKTAVIIVLIAIISIDAQLSTLSSTRPPCKGVPDGTFVQDPSSCKGWLQCFNDEGKIGQCKDGYLFDRRTGSCNYKDKVDCVTRNPCKGKNDGTFVKDHATCASYYVCINEDPKLGSCPDDTNFDPTTQRCVAPKDYPCNSTGPTLEDIVCQGLPDYSFVENENICGEYFVCVGERGRPGRCPNNYLYNPKKGICDFKESIDCPEVVPTPEPEKNVCDGVENGRFIRDPSSCPAYFQCIDGEPISGKCDDGLWFNPIQAICDYPHNVDCTPNPCEGKRNGEFMPNPEICGTFIQCVDGVGKPGSCPDGLLFNPLNGYCDYKENVDCDNPETTAIETESTTTSTEGPTSSSSTEEISTGETSTEPPSSTRGTVPPTPPVANRLVFNGLMNDLYYDSDS